MELFELIQTLNTAHGPSGDEGAVREAVAGLARPYADEVAADTLGNLIVRKRGSGHRVMPVSYTRLDVYKRQDGQPARPVQSGGVL